MEANSELAETLLPELSFDDFLSADESTPTKKSNFISKEAKSPNTSLTSSPETSNAKPSANATKPTANNGNATTSKLNNSSNKTFVVSTTKPLITTIAKQVPSINAVHQEDGVVKVAKLVKLAPKPLPSGTALKSPTSGKIYLIPGPNGTKVPVRLAANPAAASSSHTKVIMTGKPVMPVIRNSAGNLVHLKTGKNINFTNMQLAGKKIITSAGGPSIVIKSPTATTTMASGSTTIKTIPSNKIIKTITMPDGQNKITKILPAGSVVNNISGNTLIGGNKVVIPKMVKVAAPHGQGQVHTIQIPSSKAGGTGGYQLVRILNAPGIVDSPNKGDAKFTVVKQNPASSKLVVTSPRGQAILPKQTITHLRKIDTSGAKFLNIVKKEPVDEMTIGTVNSKKPEINKDMKLREVDEKPPIAKTPVDSTAMTGGKKILVVPQAMFRQDIRSRELASKKARELVNVTKKFTFIEPKIEPVDHDFPQSTSTSSALQTSVGRPRSASPPNPAEAIRRKHCNCTKSQCLKLYCDCFANGEFCQDCNCKDCFNNLEYEDERQKAIKACLERNPSAFKPKITTAESDLRQHNKGCNCKRSSCLKNYCECYEAKIACSSNCKCVGCRNVEDRPDLDLDSNSNQSALQRPSAGTKRTYEEMDVGSTSAGQKAEASYADDQAIRQQKTNLITPDVVDASVQCMIAQVDECMKSNLPYVQTERMILEELSRCLVEIIDFSIREGN